MISGYRPKHLTSKHHLDNQPLMTKMIRKVMENKSILIVYTFLIWFLLENIQKCTVEYYRFHLADFYLYLYSRVHMISYLSNYFLG